MRLRVSSETEEVLKGLNFAFASIDNVLIASRDIKEHNDHLQQVFERPEHFGLKINVNKCKFTVPQLTFFCHVIDKHSIALVPEKVAATQQFSQPTSSRQLWRYLGLIITKDLFQVAQKS